MSGPLTEARTSSASNVITALDEIEAAAKEDLTTPVEIESARGIPKISGLPLEKNADGKFVWREIADVSAVATDLKGSTAVSYGKQDRVGARLYQAVTGSCSRVLQRFEPGFVDIQGDGLFALFAGDRHAQRAMCAAITLNALGHRLKQMLKEQLGGDVEAMQDSGLKIGADRGLLLVKRIGVRGNHNEPVWAGKPVNYATKCAQQADAGEVIVTSRFFKEFKDNEYIRFSCGCVAGEPGGNVGPLWRKTEVEKLGEVDATARLLKSAWCRSCGADFSAAILRGEKERTGLNTGPIKKWIEDSAVEPTGGSDG